MTEEIANKSNRIENKYQKYIDQNALDLTDSIYKVVWGDLDLQKKDICDEGNVNWRNFILELKESEISNYRNTIDTTKYKILIIEKQYNYSIDEFKVINLIKKDTFSCSIYKNENKYYFSSTISIKHE